MSCCKYGRKDFLNKNSIFYFSGTGNSKYVAETLSQLLNSTLSFIPEINSEELVYEGGGIGFVFPVYSWGVPPLVLDFIKKIPESFWEKLKLNQGSVWAVMTCGDEVALAPEMLMSCLKRRGIEINGIWSVIMPNNYVLLPGFDVDSKKVEENKLEKVGARLKEISQAISQDMRTIDVTRGSFPFLKTKLVYPLFKKWGINTKKWHFTTSCIGCGKCSKVCPMLNIKMKNGHPEWDTRCVSCLGCYHICPVHAVAYGKETMKKGQYFLHRK